MQIALFSHFVAKAFIFGTLIIHDWGKECYVIEENVKIL